MKPIWIGILSAIFFTFTYVLNRSMALSGGSWIWSGTLRYLWMVPMLWLVLVCTRTAFAPLWNEFRKHPVAWIVWSTVGFGLFYAPLCFAAAYSPGWLVAGTFQITIVSGSLLAPLFYETVQTASGPVRVRGKIPLLGLLFSFVILIGIALMQFSQAEELTVRDMLYGIVPIVVSSFAYPLGNRKMMDLCGGRLHVTQRVLGMTIASVPFWLILMIFGLGTAGLPSADQVVQSLLVALFAGVVATLLFFRATDLVRGDMHRLAAVEATQSMEVLFSVIFEIIFLHAILPSAVSWAGIVIVMAGMVLHSKYSHKTA